jgi:site-specific recombinase XerD
MKNNADNLSIYIKRYFTEYLPQHRNYSPLTNNAYGHALRLFLLYLRENKKVTPVQVSLRDFSVENILDFLNYIQANRENSAATRNARLAALRSFVKYLLIQEPVWAADLQRILAIPVKKDSRHVVEFLTKNEMDALLAAPDSDTWSGRRDRLLFSVMYNTGARVSEIIAVRVSNLSITPKGAVKLMGKGRKERIIPLWKSTTENLRDWIAQNQYKDDMPLFPNKRGTSMTRSGVEKRLKETVKKAQKSCLSLKKKRISPHTLRHTTAMHMLQSGSDITVIAMWLGHESIETTNIYITADMEMKEKALKSLQDPSPDGFRYTADDELLSFLESL